MIKNEDVRYQGLKNIIYMFTGICDLVVVTTLNVLVQVIMFEKGSLEARIAYW